MSILIKGMKMPKYCAECDAVNDEELLCPFTDDDCEDYFRVRNENCPLIKLPLHGKLIDADSKTFPTFHRNPSNDYMKGWNACLRSVQQQPIIIQTNEEAEV